MIKQLGDCLREYRQEFYLLVRHYQSLNKPVLMRSELLDEFNNILPEGEETSLAREAIGRMVRQCQEAAVQAPWVAFALRPRVAVWHYVKVHLEVLEIEELTVGEYLIFKENLVNGKDAEDEWGLEIDLGPFNRDFPRMTESRSIGRGVEFLNRHLASRLFVDLGKGDQRLLDFLRVHQYQNMQLLLNERIEHVSGLRQAIRHALEMLEEHAAATPWTEIRHDLQNLGFEPGWGNTVERVRDNLHLLSDILEAPEPSVLGKFFGRMPMIFNIVVISPHGFFGQDNVLGLPDTGGQIVYILNQIRALEKEMWLRLERQGLEVSPHILVVTRLIPEAQGTHCDQRTEPILGTRDARILRVPFRNRGGEIVPQWISRFEIWPYLERFARDAETEILAELGDRPDLVVGNYSDGNLVASLLSQRLQVTQCNVAHALEKSKYLLSDLYWKNSEDQYHFSCQFTADLIAMNTADFIVTSTYQEIAGTSQTLGQYESYASFTMPGLYRVVNGIDVHDPKFNIVSPGADPELFFDFREEDRRVTGLHAEIDRLLFSQGEPGLTRGVLADPEKPLLFSMARFDRIKNLTGLIEWYGRSERLRSLSNLLVSGGHVDPSHSRDREEYEQVCLAHELMDRYELDGEVRWLGTQIEQSFAGELYRYIADRRGAFVQPALFEAFGLTVVEAMVSGLPTFATCYGGPLEIIEHGVSGYHIDPNHGDEAADLMADFLAQCREDPAHWLRIAEGGIKRVKEKYTWELYAQRMLSLSCIYGFWKYVTNLERDETRRYLEVIYGLQYRSLAQSLEQ